MKHLVSLLFLITLPIISFAAEQKIEAIKAPFYVGQKVMACGQVKEIKQIKNRTYLNLDNKWPNQSLTILIWDSNLKSFTSKFGNLTSLVNHRICSRGEITNYKGNLQIVLRKATNLRLMSN